MKIQSISALGCLFLCIFTIHTNAQERTNPEKQQAELGKVSWYRDYDAAIAIAQAEDKGVLVFFQEVPGCSTSVGYGQDVFCHPLMVEAVEDLFVPLVIFNNVDGKDKKILDKFNEPSWNNPVVRIIDANGKGLVKRVAGDYTATGLYTAMETALEVQQKPVPQYLQLLGQELAGNDNRTTKDTYFKMYCFWTGERHLGKAEGVLATEPGFMGGHEVVKVTYDSAITDNKTLTQHAKNGSSSPIAADGSYRIAKSDVKYSLKHTHYKYLPLTALQQTKINSALDSGSLRSGEKYLSPKQLKWLRQIEKNAAKTTVLYNKDFDSAWELKSGK